MISKITQETLDWKLLADRLNVINLLLNFHQVPSENVLLMNKKSDVDIAAWSNTRALVVKTHAWFKKDQNVKKR